MTKKKPKAAPQGPPSHITDCRHDLSEFADALWLAAVNDTWAYDDAAGIAREAAAVGYNRALDSVRALLTGSAAFDALREQVDRLDPDDAEAAVENELAVPNTPLAEKCRLLGEVERNATTSVMEIATECINPPFNPGEKLFEAMAEETDESAGEQMAKHYVECAQYIDFEVFAREFLHNLTPQHRCIIAAILAAS